jgi:hypothetical protein
MVAYAYAAQFPAETEKLVEVKSADIPSITDDDGTHVRLVCGHFWGKTGLVEGIAADPTYLDVSVPPGKRKILPVETARHAFAYVFGGSGIFCNASEPLAVPTEGVGWWPHATPPAEVDNRALVLFDHGDEVVVQGGESGIRFLLVSGQPLQEPVAWYGPIVMNTQAELRQAFGELLLFDKHYEEQNALVDAIAERIQLLGGVSIAMAPDVAEMTLIPRPPRGREEAPVQISRLLHGHEIVLKEARTMARLAAEGGDDGTNDLIVSDVIRRNELQVWFVAEHVVDLPLTQAV